MKSGIPRVQNPSGFFVLEHTLGTNYIQNVFQVKLVIYTITILKI